MAYENSPASASASASNQPQALTLVDIKRKLAQMHPGAHFRFPDSTGCTFEDKTSLKNKNLLDKSSCTAMLRLGTVYFCGTNGLMYARPRGDSANEFDFIWKGPFFFLSWPLDWFKDIVYDDALSWMGFLSIDESTRDARRAFMCYIFLDAGHVQAIQPYEGFLENLQKGLLRIPANASIRKSTQAVSRLTKLHTGSETKEVGNDPESELEDGRANSNKRQRLSSPSPLLTEARNMPEKVSKEKFTPFKVRKVSLQGSVNTASPEANPSAVMAGATSLMATPISEPSPVFAPGQDTQDDPIAAIERRNAENTQDITAMHSELLTLRHRLANHTNLTQLISKQTTEIKHLKRSESKYRKLSKDQEAQLTRVQADLRVERRLRIKAKKELSELLEGQASLVAKYKR